MEVGENDALHSIMGERMNDPKNENEWWYTLHG